MTHISFRDRLPRYIKYFGSFDKRDPNQDCLNYTDPVD